MDWLLIKNVIKPWVPYPYYRKQSSNNLPNSNRFGRNDFPYLLT